MKQVVDEFGQTWDVLEFICTGCFRVKSFAFGQFGSPSPGEQDYRVPPSNCSCGAPVQWRRMKVLEETP